MRIIKFDRTELCQFIEYNPFYTIFLTMSFTTALSIKDLMETLNKLEARIRVLEGNESKTPKDPKVKVKKAKEPKEAKEAKKPKEAKEAKEAKETKETDESQEKKRGRKPSNEISLASILKEGEHITARIPLGDRKFDEYDIVFTGGSLTVTETGESYEHPTTLVSSLAKILEDCGERSSECSKSMNGWMLCVASRNGKRVTLEKLKPQESVTHEDTSQDATEEFF